jgi:hypothetical protein
LENIQVSVGDHIGRDDRDTSGFKDKQGTIDAAALGADIILA